MRIKLREVVALQCILDLSADGDDGDDDDVEAYG